MKSHVPKRMEGEAVVITGLLVKTRPGKGEFVAKQLRDITGISIHGVFEEYKIVTVLETGSINDAHNVTNEKIIKLEDVTGAFPTYINWDEGKLYDTQKQ